MKRITIYKVKGNWPALAVFFYVAAGIFTVIGFYKMLFYRNSDSWRLDSINSYVGGDAYNYIINANYATAFFVLALVCVVIASTNVICEVLKSNFETSSLDEFYTPSANAKNIVEDVDLPPL